jgi:hypothetical protein
LAYPFNFSILVQSRLIETLSVVGEGAWPVVMQVFLINRPVLCADRADWNVIQLYGFLGEK